MVISVVLGSIFQVAPVIVGMHALLMLYNFYPHCNVRVGFGRGCVLLNCPQFHRLHHSALLEHRDCNFAAVFPVFDVLFGTYRQPGAGEYPPTGIDGGARPRSLTAALAWPWRAR
jgi:sterol desaturase/sphingolipid hydroxylase (fatty acid hydroxylase superfamily)